VRLSVRPSEIFRNSRKFNHTSCESHGERGRTKGHRYPPPPWNARLMRTAIGMFRPRVEQHDGGGLSTMPGSSQSRRALEVSFAIP
jgi:hypothetical protein